MAISKKYIIINESDIHPHINDGQPGDDNFLCRSIYGLLGLHCVEIGEALLDTLKPSLPRSFEEVTADEAYNGSRYFGDIRDSVSEWELAPDIDYTLAMDTSPLTSGPPEGSKVTKVFTEEVKGHIRSFMYKFAKEIIENEYSKKLRYVKNVSELEASTWEIQKHEAREWLTYAGASGSLTPFLDYVATEREFDKTVLANKILEKAEAYQDKLSTILVESQKLLKKFETATNVSELNILYEDYFGIMMPTDQAIALGRADDGINEDGTINPNKKGLRMAWFASGSDSRVASGSGETPTEWLPDVINPYLGNKLNF
jgi:hypothetical protein